METFKSKVEPILVNKTKFPIRVQYHHDSKLIGAILVERPEDLLSGVAFKVVENKPGVEK